jgi:hypothetical protein
VNAKLPAEEVPLKTEAERKFCHACGGWCIVNYEPCLVCDGRGVVTVLLPVVEEMALAE